MTSIVVRTLAFAALVGLLFVPLERAFGARRGPRRGRTTDALFATVGEIVSRVGLVFVVAVMLAALEPLAPERSWLPDTLLGRVLEVVLGLFVIALGGYVYHRLAHAVPFLWRLHAVHHSSESLDWLAAFRRHPLEVMLTTIVQNAPVVLLGIPLGAHVAVIVLLRINTVFVHSNLHVRAGFLRYVLVTPDYHHRHHARHGAPKNFSSIFPFIDHLFGTASHEEAGELGLDTPMPETFTGLMLHPFRVTSGREHRSDLNAAPRTPAHARERLPPGRPISRTAHS
jgi:sterol desaturase/sphingolipid hydroxylase (fatty acid hydroxylase superfamily)